MKTALLQSDELGERRERTLCRALAPPPTHEHEHEETA
jgi:hypothetical protein